MRISKRLKLSNLGFTLTEVALFLAISAMLALIALAGFGPRLRNVRFSTGMREIQADIKSKLSASALGENSGSRQKCSVTGDQGPSLGEVQTSGRGATADCVLIGRVVGLYPAGTIKDKPGYIGYYDVVARRTPISGKSAYQCTGLEKIITCYKPTAHHSITDPDFGNIAQANSEKTFPNGIDIKKGGIIVFGTIQDPNGLNRYNFFWKGVGAELTYGGTNTDDKAKSVFIVDPYTTRPSGAGKICFGLSGRTASLQFDVNKNEPELKFESC